MGPEPSMFALSTRAAVCYQRRARASRPFVPGARVAELVDAADSKSAAARLAGSSPASGTSPYRCLSKCRDSQAMT